MNLNIKPSKECSPGGKNIIIQAHHRENLSANTEGSLQDTNQFEVLRRKNTH